MKRNAFLFRPLAVAALAVLIAASQAFSQDRTSTDAEQDVKGRVGSFTQPASNDELLRLGSSWSVTECCGWTGVWTRRPGTNTFDARWTGPNGMIATDTMTLRGWDKATNRIVISRQNNNGTYWGVVNPANWTIGSGGTSWYPAGATWSAQMNMQ